MSASTLELPPNSTEAPRAGISKWLALSVVVHGLLLGWLIYLKPVQTFLGDAPERKDAAVTASSERIQEIAEQINATQADEIKAKVEELLTTEQQLAEIGQQSETEFAALAQELAMDAPQKALDAIANAMQAQEAAQQAQSEALKGEDELNQNRKDAQDAATPAEKADAKAKTTDAETRVKDAQEKAKSAQAAATDAQTKATQQLGFVDESFAQARRTQTDAATAQATANSKQDDAAARLDKFDSAKHLDDKARATAENAQRSVKSAANQVESKQRDLKSQEGQLEQQQKLLGNLENISATAKARADAAATAKAKAEAEKSQASAAKTAEKTQATIANLREKIAKTQADIEKAKQKVEDATQKVAQAQTDAEAASKALAEEPAKARAAQAEAMDSQKSAREVQSRAMAAIAKAAQTKSSETVASTTQNPSASQTPQAATVTRTLLSAADAASQAQQASAALDGKTFAELYQTAVAAEQKIAERYKAVRATEAAKLRQIPVAEAAKSIEVAQPVRPPLDPAIGASNIQDAKALAAHNEAIEKALQQLDSMVALARGMAFQARNSGGEMGVNVSVESLKAQAADARQLAQLALENPGQAAADLTGLMKQIESGGSAGTSKSAASDGGSPSAGAGAAGGGGQGKSGAATSGVAQGSGAAGGPGQGGGIKAPGALSGQPGVPARGSIAESIPGRKIHATGDGGGTKWMFVDSWYVIGPFPNPQRRNINTRFPPESVVDLDAIYPGKDGKLVRWQFKQTTQAAMRPPDEESYAIYYAYTTLWFDEPRDMWIAVGSDDYSNLWINDLLVWASGPVQKVWKADEGYRKVHFKRGLNRVLFRVENGQAACLFSLMLCMKDEK